jgi:hypothetical protein
MTDEELALLNAQRGNLTAGMGGSLQAPGVTPSYDYGRNIQSGGAPSSSELQTSPDYPGGVPSQSSGPNWSAGLAALAAQQNQPQAAPPQMLALQGPTAIGSSTPSYSALNAATPQMSGIAQGNIGLGSGPLAQLSTPALGNATQGMQSVAQQLAQNARQNAVNQPDAPAAQYGLNPQTANASASVDQPYTVDPSASNAGVSSVPGFVPAPSIADHAQSLAARIASALGRAGSAVGHVVQQGAQNFSTNVSGLSSAQLASMSPADAALARRQGMTAFFNRVANPSIDAQGFRQDAYQALGSGIQAGNAAAQEQVSVAQKAAQYQVGLAANQRILASRQAVANLPDLPPGTDPAGPQAIGRLVQIKGIYAAAGNAQDAEETDKEIRDVRMQRWQQGQQTERAGQQTPNAIAPKGAVDVNGNPVATGMHTTQTTMPNGRVYYTPTAKEANPEADARVAEKAAKDNSDAATKYDNSKEVQDINNTREAAKTYFAASSLARAGNPVASQNFAQALQGAMHAPGQQARLSPALLNRTTVLSQAFGDRFQQMLDGKFEGTIPPGLLSSADALIAAYDNANHVRAMRAQANFDKANKGAAGLRGNFDGKDGLWGAPVGAAPASGQPAGTVTPKGTTNKFGTTS